MRRRIVRTRSGWSRWNAPLVAGLGVLLVLGGGVQPLPLKQATAGVQDPGGEQPQDEESLGDLAQPPDSVFLSPPRDQVRPLLRAQRAIEDGELDRATDLIGTFLAEAPAEDYLVPVPGQVGLSISVVRRAEGMLASLPPQALQGYRLRFGVLARQRLQQAVATQSLEALADLRQRYFFTEAGMEATMILGHLEMDRGNPLSAIACFQKVLALEEGRQRFEPSASVLTAACWQLAGSPEKAAQRLLEIPPTLAQRPLLPDGSSLPRFSDQRQALDWLEQWLGSQPLDAMRRELGWLMDGGDRQRNARSQPGLPLPRPKWRLPTLNAPEAAEKIAELQQQALQDPEGLTIPTVHALASGRLVVMRTPQQLLGVDFETGKRIWSFPPTVPQGRPATTELAEQAAISTTARLLWQNTLYNQSSSDGESLYLVPETGREFSPEAAEAPNRAPTANQLVAVGLAEQGRLKWTVGGLDGGVEPALAGAMFLGPPLPVEDRLYAICRKQQEVRLVVLDKASGRQVWSQQLAGAEESRQNSAAARDPYDALMPSYADGILVCPTGLGALVALDLPGRRFLWATEYESDPRYRPKPGDRWIDHRLVLAGNHAVLSSLENGKLMVFELETGAPVANFGRAGARQPTALYLAGVFRNQAILVGEDAVWAVSLMDRQELWRCDLASFGSPSGRGFLADDRYYLPTVDQFVVGVDLARGEVVESVSTDQVLGNLVSYRGHILSQGADQLACYPTDVFTAAQLQAARAQQQPSEPPPAELLEIEARLWAARGRLPAALTALEQARQVAAPAVAQVHRATMIEWVVELIRRDDPAAEEWVGKLRAELDASDNQDWVTEWIDHQIRIGQSASALEPLFAYLSRVASREQETELSLVRPLARFDRPNESAQGTPGRRREVIRLSRPQWMRATLTVVAGESPQRRTSVEQEVERWLSAREGDSLARQQQALAWVPLQLVQPGRRTRLAEQLLGANQELAAQGILESLWPAPGTVTEAPVVVDLAVARLWLALATRQRRQFELERTLADLEAGRLRLAEGAPDELAREIRDSLLSLEQNPPAENAASPAWDAVEVRVARTSSVFQTNQPVDVLVAPQRGSRWTDSCWMYWQQTSELEWFDDRGNSRGRIMTHRDPVETESRVNYRTRGRLEFQGGLGLFTRAEEVVALDLSQLQDGGGEVLWNRAVQAAEISRYRNAASSLVDEIEIQPLMIAGGTSVEITGADLAGIAFIDDRELVCIDALGGTPRWSRRLGAGSWTLLGDGQSAVLVDIEARRCEVIDMPTGRLLRRGDLPDAVQQIWDRLGADALVVAAERPETGSREGESATGEAGAGRRVGRYRFVDGTFIWQREFPASTQATRLPGHCMACLDAAGQVQIFDLETGEQLAEFASGIPAQQRDTIRGIGACPVQGRDLLVFCQNPPTANSLNVGRVTAQKMQQTEVLLSGPVQLLDRKSHLPLWQRPVQLSGFSLFPYTPPATPLLLFHRRVRVNSGPEVAGSSQAHQVVGIDMRDGRLLVDQAMPGYSVQFLHPVVVNSTRDQVELSLSQYSVRYRLVRQPHRPPQPLAYLGRDNPLPMQDEEAGVPRLVNRQWEAENARLLQRAREAEASARPPEGARAPDQGP